jgi:hypothetical protein
MGAEIAAEIAVAVVVREGDVFVAGDLERDGVFFSAFLLLLLLDSAACFLTGVFERDGFFKKSMGSAKGLVGVLERPRCEGERRRKG